MSDYKKPEYFKNLEGVGNHHGEQTSWKDKVRFVFFVLGLIGGATGIAYLVSIGDDVIEAQVQYLEGQATYQAQFSEALPSTQVPDFR